ncbi:hypothetical protein LIA77_11792 [Sarocladium implicatum]|nr:hypothetical protein LIA77_11792 [Sarocladium implicatum]
MTAQSVAIIPSKVNYHFYSTGGSSLSIALRFSCIIVLVTFRLTSQPCLITNEYTLPPTTPKMRVNIALISTLVSLVGFASAVPVTGSGDHLEARDPTIDAENPERLPARHEIRQDGLYKGCLSDDDCEAPLKCLWALTWDGPPHDHCREWDEIRDG